MIPRWIAAVATFVIVLDVKSVTETIVPVRESLNERRGVLKLGPSLSSLCALCPVWTLIAVRPSWCPTVMVILSVEEVWVGRVEVAVRVGHSISSASTVVSSATTSLMPGHVIIWLLMGRLVWSVVWCRLLWCRVTW